MSGYLIDSDILIWYLRGRQDVVGLLDGLSDEDLAISAVSQLVVMSGVRSGEEERTETFLSGFRCIPLDRSAADLAAGYVRSYRAQGVTIGLGDSIIAATAVLHHRTLVTKNVAHFPMSEIRLFAGPAG